MRKFLEFCVKILKHLVLFYTYDNAFANLFNYSLDFQASYNYISFYAGTENVVNNGVLVII